MTNFWQLKQKKMILKFIPILIFVLFEIKMVQHYEWGGLLLQLAGPKYAYASVPIFYNKIFFLQCTSTDSCKKFKVLGRWTSPGVQLLYSTKWQNNFSPEVHSTPIWQSYIYLLTTFETAFFAQITCKIIGMKGRHLS